MNRSIPWVIGALTLRYFTSVALAAPMVYEPFNYPAGTLGGANGGTGFSDAWATNSTYAVTTGSLNVGSDQGTGNSANFQTNFFTSEFDERDLASTYGADGSDLWVGYLIRVDSISAWSGLELGIPFQNNLSIGVLGGPQGIGPPSADWGMDAGAGMGPVLSTVPVVMGQSTLLVVHISFQPGPDQIDLYVDPGSVPPAVPSATRHDLDLNFHSIVLGSDFADSEFDEIRIGNSFADVVPEPPTIVLGIIAASILLLLMRTRNSKDSYKVAGTSLVGRCRNASA